MDPKDASFFSMLTNPIINPLQVNTISPNTTTQADPVEMNQLPSPSTAAAAAAATSHAAQSPRVDFIRRKLLDAANDLVYITEAEYPFEFVLVSWPRQLPSLLIQNDPPNKFFPTASEFAKIAGFGFSFQKALSDAPVQPTEDPDFVCQSLSLAQFFEPLVSGSDPFNQSHGYLQLHDTFVELFGADGVKVYMIGERKISVWILGRLQNRDVGPEEGEATAEERVLVGLKTYRVDS
ncbi:hypothetical protein BC938DRAFT_478249 [Jimgerdemannia flammicorona]|uniref:Uncharacterized protein n=1 Tax=Jimgerdemannia flammicorona TaxID=994334 RepID=A0A433QN47_9FUNG|nr:hypothetical protein BC938DRAFT_478249 [Jimgerdemannia flammicorona]